MIYTVTLNPALDRTIRVHNFTLDQVNRAQNVRIDVGGKGINVSKVIKELGATSTAVVLLAGTSGKEIEGFLAAQDIACICAYTTGQTRTNYKIVDPLAKTYTDINEPGPSASAQVLQELLNSLLAVLTPQDVVVLSGSLPKTAPTNTYATWIAAIHATGAQSYLDVDGSSLVAALKAPVLPTFIKPNQSELEAYVGHALSQTELLSVCKDLQTKGIRRLVVSQGAAGALACFDSEVFEVKAPRVSVQSTVGAGDSLLAACVYAASLDLDVQSTLRLAIATGSASVMQEGTQVPPRSLIEELMPQVTLHRKSK